VAVVAAAVVAAVAAGAGGRGGVGCGAKTKATAAGSTTTGCMISNQRRVLHALRDVRASVPLVCSST
jgi:hypothetical protein